MKRAKPICSGESLVNEETKYLPKVCHDGSDYPISIINKIGNKSLVIVKIKREQQKLMKLQQNSANFPILWKAR